MITILSAGKWRECNICMKKANVEVYFRSNFNSQGTIIALCAKCAKDMCDRVGEKLYGRKNDDEEQ